MIARSVAASPSRRGRAVPSRRLLGLAAIPAGLSMLVVLLPNYLWPILALDLLVVVVAAVDLLLSRSDGLIASADHAEVFSLGRASPIALLLRNPTDRARETLLTVDTSTGLEPELREIHLTVPAGETQEVTYKVIPQVRGQHWVLPLHTRMGSRLGLFQVQQVHASAREVRVYPDLSPIRSYELLVRQHRELAMVRASKLRGGESEFARLRDYSNDDDYRFIDWKATARRGKLTTREFQLESDQNVMLLIDSGRLMSAEEDRISHFDRALSSSLLLSHVACRGGDRVGLSCFDEEVRCFLPPQGGPKTTSRLVRASYDIHPRLTDTTFSDALGVVDSRIKQRSLLVLFTQVIDDRSAEELLRQVRHLARKHLVLVVVLKNDDLVRMARLPTADGRLERSDPYAQGAAAELLNWRHRILGTLRQSGALLIEASARELSPRLLNRYLQLKVQRAI